MKNFTDFSNQEKEFPPTETCSLEANRFSHEIIRPVPQQREQEDGFLIGAACQPHPPEKRSA
jgi:hypothetical protein